MKVTIKTPSTNTLEIKKSKFIANIFPIKSADEAKEIIKQISKEHNKANHNCYAYIVDGYEKSNDDGEPSGTAGKPILEVIKNNHLEDVLIIVTRYFGGIKLGASGLIRAYADASNETIKNAHKIIIKSLKVYQYDFDYSLINIIEKFLVDKDIRIIDKIYDVKVSYLLAINEPNFNQELIDYTLNKVKISFVNEQEFEFKID